MRRNCVSPAHTHADASNGARDYLCINTTSVLYMRVNNKYGDPSIWWARRDLAT